MGRGPWAGVRGHSPPCRRRRRHSVRCEATGWRSDARREPNPPPSPRLADVTYDLTTYQFFYQANLLAVCLEEYLWKRRGRHLRRATEPRDNFVRPPPTRIPRYHPPPLRQLPRGGRLSIGISSIRSGQQERGQQPRGRRPAEGLWSQRSRGLPRLGRPHTRTGGEGGGGGRAGGPGGDSGEGGGAGGRDGGRAACGTGHRRGGALGSHGTGAKAWGGAEIPPCVTTTSARERAWDRGRGLVVGGGGGRPLREDHHRLP